MRIVVFYFTIVFSCLGSIAHGQSFLRSEHRSAVILDSLLVKYHFFNHHKTYYFNGDFTSKSRKLNIEPQIKGRNNIGIGDFIFFLDDRGKVKNIKIASIEIKSSTEGRIFDWQFFIRDIPENKYDIFHDVGLDYDSVKELNINSRTKGIILEMLDQLRAISFSGEGQPQKESIVYCTFSF